MPIAALYWGYLYFRQFDPDAAPLDELTHLLFGNRQELFLAHLITRPPDFDQVLPVEIAGPALSDEELGRGVRVTIPGRANTIAERLTARETVEGRIRAATQPSAEVSTIRLTTGGELYFEEGELRSPPTFDLTEAEEAAGFTE